jgi:hypothetical protein
MRLRETRFLLGKYNGKIEFKAQRLNNNDYQITGLQSAINAIDNLSVLGFLDADIARLKKLGNVYYSKSPDDKMQVTPSIHSQIKEAISIVNEKIDGYLNLIDNSIPKQEENVISVKLPSYSDLNDLSDFFKNLNIALRSGLMNDKIKGSYQLKNFDTGSMWVDLLIGGSVLHFFGKLIETAQNIQQKSIQTQQMRVQLRTLEVQQEALEQVKTALDTQINAVVEGEIKNLTGDKKFDPEALGELKLSIKTFSELIHEGAQFHPPLDAPQEVTQSFPQVPSISQLEGTTGFLEDLSSKLNNGQESQ